MAVHGRNGKTSEFSPSVRLLLIAVLAEVQIAALCRHHRLRTFTPEGRESGARQTGMKVTE